MLKRFICITVVVFVATTGSALAAPIGAQDPYFTYSPGARDFEDFEWTPLEFAAFSAYGGYFANIRRPRFETPIPQRFFEPQDFGVEDEIKIAMKFAAVPTFMPYASTFSAFSTPSEPLQQAEDIPVPEPGLLALVGTGLLFGSRALRRRFRP